MQGGPGRPALKPGPGVWIAGGAMVAVALVTAVLLFRGFRSTSYLYLFFYSIPANVAVALFPHEPVLLHFGKFADPWLGAAAATAGTLVAAVLDHTVFVPVLRLRSLARYRRHRVYRRLLRLYRRAPVPALITGGFLPLPFFPFKLLALSDGIGRGRYLAAVATGHFPRYALFLWAGGVLQLPTGLLVGLFAGILLVYVARALREAGKGEHGGASGRERGVTGAGP